LFTAQNFRLFSIWPGPKPGHPPPAPKPSAPRPKCILFPVSAPRPCSALQQPWRRRHCVPARSSPGRRSCRGRAHRLSQSPAQRPRAPVCVTAALRLAARDARDARRPALHDGPGRRSARLQHCARPPARVLGRWVAGTPGHWTPSSGPPPSLAPASPTHGASSPALLNQTRNYQRR